MELLKNTFFIVFNVLLILIVFSYFEDDISIEEIKKESNPDFKAESYQERLPVYMASYADGHEVFFRNQNALVKSALNTGIDYFFNYRRSHIDRDFYEKHREVLEKKRGAGYWLWKSYFILKTLEKMPENAVLIYADSGFHFKSSAMPLIEKAQKNDVILVSYDKDPYGTVKTIANKEILEMMQCETDKCQESPHLWGGFMVFRNTPHARKFVKEWLDYCSNPKIILGITDGRPQDPAYRHHMDDETVVSVLYAKKTEDKEIYLYPKEELLDIIIWHHRHPDTLNIPVKFINYIREIRRFQRKIFNQKDS